MSEAAAGGGRAEAERRIIQRSLEDDAFRQRLIRAGLRQLYLPELRRLLMSSAPPLQPLDRT